MSRTRLDSLFQASAPFILAGIGEEDRKRWITDHFYCRPGLECCARHLRGRKMRTTAALMNEFSAALQFFGDFGENWYALEDCLSCLDEWLPADAYILAIEQAEELLADEESEKSTLFKVLDTVGRSWSTPIESKSRFDRRAIPFHILLNFSRENKDGIHRVSDLANSLDIPIEIFS